MFPVLYLTLELPKRIINDAIGATSDPVTVLGIQIGQVQFLAILCVAFLASVVLNGVMKMKVNTMKGVLAERMLRRLRFQLITRIMRFPQSYFQRTSQGELVSMVTAESEQLGGMMGDAISLPVFQAGQMLTILAFLFMQSVWFALAAVALIPLQAWLIPRMQRQINLLNRSRVKEVRKLASEIGESAAGAVDLRRSGATRYRAALISDRLARLFYIRFDIYQKKFFMKFVNNFITQLTPLIFYAFGGYLVIKGNLTLGALVAALAAHKDLSAPWNELLNYYNQIQENALRWVIVTERFAPPGMIDEAIFEGEPAEIPSLAGNIELNDVTLRSAEGTVVLKDITLTIPAGATVALSVENEEDRRAVAEMLTRELTPAAGSVTVAGHDMARLHQGVIAARIGYASSRPFVVQGSFGANVMAPLMVYPQPTTDPAKTKRLETESREAFRSGNSTDPLSVDWIDPQRAGLGSDTEVRDWWLGLTEAIDTDRMLFTRGLDQKFLAADAPELAQKLVELRPEIARRLADAGLETIFFRFERDRYNPALPVAGNLLFAVPKDQITQEMLAGESSFLQLLRQLHLEKELLHLSRDVIEMLSQTFGLDGTDHPLFRKLRLDPQIYSAAVSLLDRTSDASVESLSDTDLALLLSVPFQVSAEQIGPAFSDEMKDRIVRLRQQAASFLKTEVAGLYAPLDAEEFSPGLTVLENAIFGKISESAGTGTDQLREIVLRALEDAGLRRAVTNLMFDMPTDLGGKNLTALLAEMLDLSRAVIKRPDVLILDQALASFDAAGRDAANARIRKLLPDTTIIHLQSRTEDPSLYDLHFEIRYAQIVGAGTQAEDESDNTASADLTRKLRLLETTDLFAGLDRKQQRLLAFGARWYSAPAGTYVFHKYDDPSDGAYLIAEGEAGLYLPHLNGNEQLIAKAEKGNLVGELGLIRNVPRSLTMKAHTDIVALRISAEAFLSVVQNDPATAFKLLQVVAGYVTQNAN